MILRLRVAVGANPRIELNEVGWLVVLNMTSRTSIGRHARRCRMICGHVLMQRTGVAIEALFIAYAAERLRMTRFTLNLEIAVCRMQRP